jgi:hypothetical protein
MKELRYSTKARKDLKKTGIILEKCKNYTNY